MYFICKDTPTQELLRSAERSRKTEWSARKTERQQLSWFIYLFISKLMLGKGGHIGCIFDLRTCLMNFHKIPVLVKGLQANLHIYRIKGQKVSDPEGLLHVTAIYFVAGYIIAVNGHKRYSVT
jgi:hypothetical protein